MSLTEVVVPFTACSSGPRLPIAFEIERHCGAEEIFQGRFIDLGAAVGGSQVVTLSERIIDDCTLGGGIVTGSRQVFTKANAGPDFDCRPRASE